MSKIRVGTSPLTNRVFAGRVSEKTETWLGEKHDVTDDAVSAVAVHLLKAGEKLQFDYKGRIYELLVQEVNNHPQGQAGAE